MAFPDFTKTQQDLDSILRTSEGFVKREDQDFYVGSTPLTNITSLNFFSGFPLEYMHLVCLGVTRTLIYIWMFDKIPNKMPQVVINNISAKLRTIKGWIPTEFCRNPRSLDEIKRWKAAEFRQFLLYTGPVILKDTFSGISNGHQNLDAFMCLHISMRILLDTKYCVKFNSYASEMLKRFTIVIKNLYGAHYITHNFHNLIHLASDVSTYGSLDNCSAFKFENYLSSLKRLIRKSDQPLQQIIKRLKEGSDILIETEHESNYPNTFKPHFAGPLLEGCDPNSQFEKMNINENITLGIQTPNSC